MKISEKKKQAINFITMFIVFIIMMFLNIRCPYLSDDMHFKFVWKDFMPAAADKPVESFSDILESMKNYYLLSGGRVIPHFAAYIFLAIDKMYFNIVNSLIFVYIGYLIYSMTSAVREKNDSVMYLPFIYLSLFMFIPYFGDNIIWISGATNYHWTSALFLTTISYFIKYIDSDKKYKVAFLFPLTILSASTNETTGGMLILLFISYWIVNNKKINIRFVIVNLCSLTGLLTVISSPGNINRALNNEQTDLFSFKEFIYIFTEYLLSLLKYARFFIIINAVLLFLYYLTKRENINLKYLLNKFMLFIVGCIGIMALSASFIVAERSIIHGIILMITCFWYNIPEVLYIFFNDVPELLSDKRINILFNNARIYSVICLCLSVIYVTYNVVCYNNGMKNLDNYYSQYMVNGINAYAAGYHLENYGILFPEISGSPHVISDYSIRWCEQAVKYGVDIGIR